MDTITDTKKLTTAPRWIKSYPDNDEIIDAYMHGKKRGASEIIEQAIRLTISYKERVQEDLAVFYGELKSEGNKPLLLVLKVKDNTYFEAAFVIEGDKYNSKEFDSVLERVVAIEQSINKAKDYELRILFIPSLIDLDIIKENLGCFDYVYGDTQP